MLIALGALLALVILSDAIRTTINLSEKRGPIARAVLRLGRSTMRRLPQRYRGGAGVVITILVVLSWTLGLWLAWTIALFDPAITIIDTTTGEQVGGLGRVYVAGYAIFTLGTGDLAAETQLGRLVTIVASGTGLFTVTMEVTYLVSLTSAAAHERKTARQAYAVGGDVDRMLRRSWDGRSFVAVEPLLLELASGLGQLAEEHRTFPVLHDVLPTERSLALGPTLLALVDALETMRHGVAEQHRIGSLAYTQVVDAVDAVVQSLPEDVTLVPPPPRSDVRAVLEELAAEIVDEPAGDRDAVAVRRRALYALAGEEGWQEAARAAVRVDGAPA